MGTQPGTTTAQGPLAGIRVIEVAAFAQGPIAGAVLAYLGAEVIKLEPASGDRGRGPAGSSWEFTDRLAQPPAFLWRLCNPNKHSTILDLRDGSHRERFEALVRSADAFVTNLMDETLLAFGADRDTVRALNPDIVYGRSGGFGYLGPLAGDSCQDTVGMAYAGLLDVSAITDGEVNYPQYAISDVLSGTMLAFAVVSGLLSRERLGVAPAVNTSQLQTLMWAQSFNISAAATFDWLFPRHNELETRTPLLNIHRGSDGKWLSMGLIRPGEWEALMVILDLADYLADPRFDTLQGRAEHATDLNTLIKDAIALRPRDEWLAKMRAERLTVAKVNRIQDLVDDQQVRENGFIVELEDGFHTVGMPFTIEGYQLPLAPAPALGSWEARTGRI